MTFNTQSELAERKIRRTKLFIHFGIFLTMVVVGFLIPACLFGKGIIDKTLVDTSIVYSFITIGAFVLMWGEQFKNPSCLKLGGSALLSGFLSYALHLKETTIIATSGMFTCGLIGLFSTLVVVLCLLGLGMAISSRAKMENEKPTGEQFVGVMNRMFLEMSAFLILIHTPDVLRVILGASRFFKDLFLR